MQLRCCSWRNFWNDVLNLWVSAWTLNGSSYFEFFVWRWQQICYFLWFVSVNHDWIVNRLHYIYQLVPSQSQTDSCLLSYCCFITVFTLQPFHRQWDCKFFVHVCNHFGCAVVSNYCFPSCEHMRGNILCEHKTLGIRFCHAKAFSGHW